MSGRLKCYRNRKGSLRNPSGALELPPRYVIDIRIISGCDGCVIFSRGHYTKLEEMRYGILEDLWKHWVV